MEFKQSSRAIRKSLLSGARVTGNKTNAASRQVNLQMYDEPPIDDISIKEFGEMALNRLKILRLLEQFQERFAGNLDKVCEALSK
ncbi:unnamed protein product, partial [Anisakis simplex]